MKSKNKNQKIMVFMFAPLLVISLLCISPVNSSVDPIYEVNPNFYDIGGLSNDDFQVYQFQEIRAKNSSETMERHEVMIYFPLSGIDTPVMVEEGAKIKVTVIDKDNNSYIETRYSIYHINGTVYDTDIVPINKSTLDVGVQTRMYGARPIFTTNTTLIHDVYNAAPWNYNIDTGKNMVRIWNESSTGSDFHNYEEYEYGLIDGWLQRLSIHSSGPDEWENIELSRVDMWNPDWFELGVSNGDSNIYVVQTARNYDHYDDKYRYEFHVQYYSGGTEIGLNLYRGDEIYVEVISTSGDFVKCEITYKTVKDGQKYKDEKPYIIDKSTLWSPRKLGAPLLMTINKTFLQNNAPLPEPPEFDGDVVKFQQENDDDPNWYDRMEGSWNLTTGWMLRFYNIHIEDPNGDKIVQHEWEIVDEHLYVSSEEYIGVNEGDSITYKLKEVINNEGNSDYSLTSVSGDEIEMPIMVDGHEEDVTVQEGDELTITVEEISGNEIRIVMTVDSKKDGEVKSDPIVFDILDPFFDDKEGGSGEEDIPEDGNRGGMIPYIVPANKDMIKELFGDVDFDEENNRAKMMFSHEGFEQTLVYDIETGWLLEYSHIWEEDGEIIQKIVLEYTQMVSGGETEDKDGAGELTPLPILPVILALVMTAGIIQKRRKD